VPVVTWWSGGGPSVLLVARLARPTHWGGDEVAAALVLFPTTVAMGRRLPVMVFPVAARRCARHPLARAKAGRYPDDGGKRST
jgi:hypothetical protein